MPYHKLHKNIDSIIESVTKKSFNDGTLFKKYNTKIMKHYQYPPDDIDVHVLDKKLFPRSNKTVSNEIEKNSS